MYTDKCVIIIICHFISSSKVIGDARKTKDNNGKEEVEIWFVDISTAMLEKIRKKRNDRGKTMSEDERVNEDNEAEESIAIELSKKKIEFLKF